MWRSILSFSAIVGLSACGDGNPFSTPEETTEAGAVLTAIEFDENLTGNGVVYNDNGTPASTDDTLVINNVPFDSSDETGGAYTFQRTLPNGFEIYESPATGLTSGDPYFAIFQRTSNAQVTTVGTDGFVSFGFGGVIAERLTEAGIPAARSQTYQFTGQYAGLRIFRADSATAFVTTTGDARLAVDILDLDGQGAITGTITNRQSYTLQGVLLGSPGDFISFGTTNVDTANATINPGTATSVQGGEELASGQWSGLFAGPNGEEIAGIVVIEGDPTSVESGLGSGAKVREHGAFIVINDGT